VSDQERTDEPQEKNEEEMQDLDVPEEQTDDVTGGKKRFGGAERGTRGMK
jgi:hypothetical protein